MDTFLDGRLRLIQSMDGYRFSVDALFLTGFATVRPGDAVVDLGTGCGVMPLVLLMSDPAPRYALGVEIQPELVDQARRNIRLNRLSRRASVVRGDIRRVPLKPRCADVVICNPPYRRIRSGRINPDPRKAVARHELLASIDDIIPCAARLLRKRGRFAVIFPAARLPDLLLRMRRGNLEPKRIQIQYPSLARNGELVLVEAVTGGKPGTTVEPPLLGQGAFSAETEK